MARWVFADDATREVSYGIPLGWGNRYRRVFCEVCKTGFLFPSAISAEIQMAFDRGKMRLLPFDAQVAISVLLRR